MTGMRLTIFSFKAYMALANSIEALDGNKPYCIKQLIPLRSNSITRNNPNPATRRYYCFLNLDRA